MAPIIYMNIALVRPCASTNIPYKFSRLDGAFDQIIIDFIQCYGHREFFCEPIYCAYVSDSLFDIIWQKISHCTLKRVPCDTSVKIKVDRKPQKCSDKESNPYLVQ